MKKLITLAMTAIMSLGMLSAATAAINTVDYDGHHYQIMDESMNWVDAR